MEDYDEFADPDYDAEGHLTPEAKRRIALENASVEVESRQIVEQLVKQVDQLHDQLDPLLPQLTSIAKNLWRLYSIDPETIEEQNNPNSYTKDFTNMELLIAWFGQRAQWAGLADDQVAYLYRWLFNRVPTLAAWIQELESQTDEQR